MKVVGLVTEYNPFHNGHLHHLVASKKASGATHAIAVMSGHFLQRGEPAIMDKWTRAKNAVDAGVDLVIELPTLFSCSSAEYFAYGAVSLLKDLNIVDALCFGSETGSLNEMGVIANLLSAKDPELFSLIDAYLKKGVSYPSARAQALDHLLGHQFDFKPNNILGIEYMKAINLLDSPFEPVTIQRIQADYMSTELKGSIASATGIRKSIHKHAIEKTIRFVPETTYESILSAKTNYIFPEHLGQMLLYKIRSMSEATIRNIHDVSEGLESRIKKAAETAYDYNSLVELILTKRYTKTRIQRILVKILLDISTDMLGQTGAAKPLYARILAFNTKGQEILSRIRKTSDIPLVTNINRVDISSEAKDMLTLDIKASNIYNLLYPYTKDRTGGKDHLTMPYRKE